MGTACQGNFGPGKSDLVWKDTKNFSPPDHYTIFIGPSVEFGSKQVGNEEHVK